MSEETFAGEPLDPYALKDEITRLRAENAKLWEVLNDVTKELDQFVNIFKGYQGMKMSNAQAALRAARAALEGVTDKNGEQNE